MHPSSSISLAIWDLIPDRRFDAAWAFLLILNLKHHASVQPACICCSAVDTIPATASDECLSVVPVTRLPVCLLAWMQYTLLTLSKCRITSLHVYLSRRICKCSATTSVRQCYNDSGTTKCDVANTFCSTLDTESIIIVRCVAHSTTLRRPEL